jgi:hypothetical protein
MAQSFCASVISLEAKGRGKKVAHPAWIVDKRAKFRLSGESGNNKFTVTS